MYVCMYDKEKPHRHVDPQGDPQQCDVMAHVNDQTRPSLTRLLSSQYLLISCSGIALLAPR